MRFGHFDDEAREYVITTPQTPYPWINYLGSESFFSLLSHQAGGYSFYRDPRLRRLTRYRYNNVPNDAGGRYLYVNDGGDVWTPSWLPVKADLDHFEARHGLGYSRITGERNGLSVSTVFFVPLGEDAEVQRISVTNTSDAPKSVALFSFVEFCLWNAHDDQTNYQRNLSIGEVEIEPDGPYGSAIYHRTEYRERRDHFAVYALNTRSDGFDTDRDTFVGPFNSLGEAAVPRAGRSADSVASGWYPIGSHSVQLDLGPGESRDLVLVLGYIENPEAGKWADDAHQIIDKTRAHALLARFATAEQADAALAELRQHWAGLLTTYRVSSTDEKLDRMVNIWNQYQCMVTFNLSRSASFFEAGIGRGMGFRDSNQDLLGFIHLAPDRARERILDIAATQFEDGSVFHQYQPLTKRGNAAIGGNFNDDPLWLILSTSAYLKETGDFSILEELVPFENDETRTGTLLSHLRASFDHVINNLGPHGLPLIGRADWNDCLNLNCFSTNPNESFQTTGIADGRVAESVFIAAMFVLYGSEYARLCRRVDRADEAQRAEQKVATMTAMIELHGWDGEWFLRAYDAAGQKVGSHENEESRIFIEPQGFAVMAGIGLENGKARQALDAVNTLLACPYGIVLNYPAFTRYHLEYGEISTYPQGYKENGGIFCHNNPWIMIGETRLGRGDRAFDYYCRIAPAWQEHVSLRRIEPYVYAQMVAGKEAQRPGEAKNSWLTGTAAWNYHAITEHILGIKPEYDGLLIDPCIPGDWLEYRVTRKFRGSTYHIRISNPAGVSKGVASIFVNGVLISGNLVSVTGSGGEYSVEVTMG